MSDIQDNAPQAIVGTMNMVISDSQIADLLTAAIPTTVAASTTAAPIAPIAPAAPAVTPAISDEQMKAAAEALTHGARMYHGMLDAAAALFQVGSLGSALNERQNALNGLDSQIADRKARIGALDQTIADQVKSHELAMNQSLQKASDTQLAASNQATAILQKAQADAAALTLAARQKAAELLDQANQTATNVQMQVAAEQQAINDLKNQQAVLQGQVSDLETNIAVAKANLRQLLGDA